MARCANCGTDNKPDARFCGKCGRMVVASSGDSGSQTTLGVDTASISLSRSQRRWILGLALVGLVLATWLGYLVGTWSAGSLTDQIDRTAAGAPDRDNGGDARHTEAATPAKKSRKSEAKSAKQATQPAEGAPGEQPTEQQTKLRQEMAACGTFNLICQEKARWTYCKGLWGKIPECPQSNPNIPGGG